MNHYLVFMIEPYRLMVDALWVHELLVRGEIGRVCGGGHVAWRSRMVPIVGLAGLLGRAAPEGGGSVELIYGAPGDGERSDDGVVIFEADRVLGLRAVREFEVRPLPPLAPTLARLFGGMVLDPVDGKGILWLKARAGALLAMAREGREAVAVAPGSGAPGNHS